MPNIKSAKKRVKVIKVKTLQNKMHTTALKTEIKKFDAAVASGDKEAAQVAYKAAVKKIDQAARMLGSDLPDPMMYMFFLPITAIPDYAITDVGPVDYLALTTFDPVLEVNEK